MNRRQLLLAAAAAGLCTDDPLTERQRQLLLLSHLPPPETWEDYERERVFDPEIEPDIDHLEGLGFVLCKDGSEWGLSRIVTSTDRGEAYLRHLGLMA